MEAVRTAEGHQLAIRIIRLRYDGSPLPTIADGVVSKGGSPSMPAEAPFGTVHLGERFASLLLLSNEGVSRLRGITVKVELQTSSQRMLLHDEITPSTTPTELEAGQQASLRTQHDIRELGVHVLICSVHYECDVIAERKFLRKFFKFTVINPLTLKTKISELPGQLLLEAQLHNVAGSRFILESVTFDLPPEQMQGQQLTCETIGGPPMSSMEGLSLREDGTRVTTRYGSQLLAPENIFQYVFIIKPATTVSGADFRLFNKQQALTLGRLDIQWRTAEGGECGRLQTGVLTHQWEQHEGEGMTIGSRANSTRSTAATSPPLMVPSMPAAISIALGGCPSRARLQRPLEILIILQNDTDRTLSDVRILWEHPSLVHDRENTISIEAPRRTPSLGGTPRESTDQPISTPTSSPSHADWLPAFAPIGPPILYLGTLTAFNSTRARMKIMPLLPGLQQSRHLYVQYGSETPSQRGSDGEIDSTTLGPNNGSSMVTTRRIPIHFTIFIESLGTCVVQREGTDK